jgi:hypothetical protein
LTQIHCKPRPYNRVKWAPLLQKELEDELKSSL